MRSESELIILNAQFFPVAHTSINYGAEVPHFEIEIAPD